MPVLPPAPLGIRCIAKGYSYASPWANIFYLQYTAGTPTASDLTTLATSVGASYHTNLMLSSTTGTHLTSMTLVDINTNSGNSGVDLTDRQGLIGTAGLPAQCTMVVSWKISRRYRGGHPRNYLPGPADSLRLDFQHWTTTAATNQQAGGIAFITAVNALSSASTGSVRLGTYSFYQGVDPTTHKPILRAIPLFEQYITAHVDARIDTQRRRLGKGGG